MKWPLEKPVTIGFGLVLALLVDMCIRAYQATHQLFNFFTLGNVLALFLIGFVIYILRRDINRRIEADGALQKSRDQYQSLFQANPHPTWVYDLKTLTF